MKTAFKLLLSTMVICLAPFTRGELAYLCNPKNNPDDLSVYNEGGYKDCRSQCTCTALETLCFIMDQPRFLDRGVKFTFGPATVQYSKQCNQAICLCNWWSDEQAWRTYTEKYLGLEVPREKPVPVPVPGSNNQQFPQNQVRQTSGPKPDEDCQESVTCTMWWEPNWSGVKTTTEYPCRYLRVDVCYGAHACECSNGYAMVTEGMPDKRSGVLDEIFPTEMPTIEDFPADGDIFKLVVFAASVLLVLCSIPCVCIVCCCRQRSYKLQIKEAEDRHQRNAEISIQDAQIAQNLQDEIVAQERGISEQEQVAYEMAHLEVIDQEQPEDNSAAQLNGGIQPHVPDFSIEVIEPEEIVNPQDLPGPIEVQAHQVDYSSVPHPAAHLRISVDSNPIIGEAIPYQSQPAQLVEAPQVEIIDGHRQQERLPSPNIFSHQF